MLQSPLPKMQTHWIYYIYNIHATTDPSLQLYPHVALGYRSQGPRILHPWIHGRGAELTRSTTNVV